MENFKSFGNKLTVPFFPGFTAITGPNGSGKSNIADAILFVLGPKSSKVMRAGRLTDLIFNGGKKHKNPSKYCKVSLVFDNTSRKLPIDSNEVVLTRMIKRAPLKNDPDNYYSYFYINNRAASFGDFIDLLNHARISGDGYNIVKQGDVTSIIELGSIERRKLIDDIAGISTFDNDIKKAEKEREDVDTNLDRIRIILSEISTQIRQLKNDRDAAFRYKELQEKLYELKAKVAVKKKQDVETQIGEIIHQIESYEQERDTLNEKAKELKQTYGTHQKELEEIEQKIGDVGGDDVKEIKQKIDDLRSEIVKIEERINYSSDEIIEQQNEGKDQISTVDTVETELNEYKNNINELQQNIETQQTTIDEKESELSHLKETIAQSDDHSMDITRELTKMRHEYDEKTSKIHELKLHQDRLNEKLEALDLQIAEIQESKSTYEFEIKDIDWQATEWEKEHKQNQKKQTSIEKTLFDKKKNEAELTKKLTELETTIRRLQREQAKLQAEYDALQTVSSKYNRAVNEILQARDTGILNGIHGTITELAQVDEQYQLAVEVAAGNRMQAIIVDDDEAAAKGIAFLQKQNLGRATFLPLNKMISGKPRGNALMIVDDSKSHGFAIDLVKFHPEYRNAFWYVFGDTIVVEGLDDARRLMGGVRLVDLKGSLIEASGAMIGGSRHPSGLSFSKIDRSKLDTLTQQLQEAINHQENLSSQIIEIKKEITDLENSLGTFIQKSDSEGHSKDLDVRRKEYATKLQLLLTDLEGKEKERNEIEQERIQLDQSIEELTQRLAELDELKDEKGKLLLKGTKKELAQQARSLEEELSSFRESLLNMTSEKDALEKKVEILIDRKAELDERVQTTEQEITRYKEQIKELKQSRSRCHDELKALMSVEEQMTGKVKQLTITRDEIYRKAVSLETDLDKINTRIESYYDLISRAKYRLPTLEATVKELEEELKLYHVEVTDTKLPPVESLKDSIRVTEETMRELEPVNMRALEEYDHQVGRKNTLDDDVKHLKDQKKNLEKLVGEITEKKKEKFYEVFDEVNRNFKMIYGQLSEGGEAELQLEDPEHLFESGLTIKARPRGKKVLLLSALSGGEKSIASLAFIFAIQNYDPSPFYVLDEVDMFLDGVNAETVSRMIKRNSLDSQFIMVSLRKVALKEANHVYGVTMREDGISNMIGNIDPATVGSQGELPSGGGRMYGAA